MNGENQWEKTNGKNHAENLKINWKNQLEKSVGKINGKNQWENQWEKSMGKINGKNQWEKTMGKIDGKNQWEKWFRAERGRKFSLFVRVRNN